MIYTNILVWNIFQLEIQGLGIDMENNNVTLCDANGSTYNLTRTVYNGETFDLYKPFISPGIALPSLNLYQPRTDDVWLLTYQKAGTHWVYEIIGILLSGTLEPLSYTKGKDFIEFNPEALKSNDERILNTHMHERFLPKCIFEKCKTIVVVRNPKSVTVSSYHFTKSSASTKYTGTFSGYLKTFMQNGAVGEYSGTWYSYYCTFWRKYKANPNVLFVFFEDLKKNSVTSIMTIAKFLGLERDHKFCEDVAQLASFKNMKSNLGKKATSPAGSSIQRKGMVDDWKNEFTVAENEDFDVDFEEKMKDCQDLAKLISFS